MAQITLTVCDVCADVKKDTSDYVIGKDGDGQPKKMALCINHAAPLEVLLGNRKRSGRKAAAATPAAKKAASASPKS